MRFGLGIVILFLGIIAYKLPTAEEIGDQVALAPGRLRDKADMAYAEQKQKEDAAEAEQKRNEAVAAAEREQQQQQAAAQAAFDALPKVNAIGYPINRVPPRGLHPTAGFPVVPKN